MPGPVLRHSHSPLDFAHFSAESTDQDSDKKDSHKFVCQRGPAASMHPTILRSDSRSSAHILACLKRKRDGDVTRGGSRKTSNPCGFPRSNPVHTEGLRGIAVL